MRGMKKAGQCLIRFCRFMIRVIGRTLPGTEFQSWMKMEIKKPESEKEKGQNIFGRKSISQPTTGMTEPMRNSGEHPGRSTATGILSRINGLITVPMNVRDWIRSRPSMKESQPGVWSRMEKRQTAV